MSGEKVDKEMLELDPRVYGHFKAPEGVWASCIRIIDPVNVSLYSILLDPADHFKLRSVAVFSLDDNEAAFSIAVVPFTARNGELLLVVGTAVDTHLAPRSCSSGYLRVYSFTEGGSGLELLHKVSPLMTAIPIIDGQRPTSTRCPLR